MRNSNQKKTDKSSKWEEIFSEKVIDGKKRIWRLVTIGSFLALIVMTVIQIAFISNTELSQTQIFTSIINFFLIPVTTAILSAAFLNIVYVTYENRQLKSIKDFPYRELAQNFFEVLEKSDGKMRKNEHIDVTLLPFKKEEKINSKLLKIRISYEFETNVLKDTILFMFERNSKGDITSYLSSSNDDLENYEFYWGNDETGTFPALEISDEDYEIEQISVNSISIEKEKISQQMKDIDGGKLIIYEADVSEIVKDRDSRGEFYNIALTVSFPMEAASILFITHEYPTKGSEMSVNYSEIENSTIVYSMPMTGPIPVNNQNISDPSREQYRYDGWLIPKTGYVIAWWKK